MDDSVHRPDTNTSLIKLLWLLWFTAKRFVKVIPYGVNDRIKTWRGIKAEILFEGTKWNQAWC